MAPLRMGGGEVLMRCVWPLDDSDYWIYLPKNVHFWTASCCYYSALFQEELYQPKSCAQVGLGGLPSWLRQG